MNCKTFFKEILLFICLVSLPIQSQNSVVSSGGDASGSGGFSSFSIGQTVYLQQSADNTVLIQGVQQPFEIMVLSNEDFKEITLELYLYPNPAIDEVHLTFSDTFNFNDASYELFDISGKRLIKKIKISYKDEVINMQNIPMGVYLLNVSKKNANLKSFKIIKNK